MSTKELIILTGGAGFIGSCFLSKLNAEGEKEIIVVDHLNSQLKQQNLAGKEYRDYYEKDAFLALLEKDRLPKNVKAIFHIGACSSTLESNEDYLLKNNFEYSKALARWALAHDSAFYYASSAAAYGSGEQGYSDADEVTLDLSPLNLYGRSKHMFDVWLIKQKLNSRVVGFRYFNVFGPNEYHKGAMRSLVVKAYEQIKQDGKICLFKSYRPEFQNGEQQRDFVYVKDVTDLMYAFYRNPSVKGIYNIGSGVARTWNVLARAIFAALGKEPRIEYVDMPEQIKDKYQYFTQADLTKLKGSGLSFVPTSLEAAVTDYVQHYLEKGFAHL